MVAAGNGSIRPHWHHSHCLQYVRFLGTRTDRRAPARTMEFSCDVFANGNRGECSQPSSEAEHRGCRGLGGDLRDCRSADSSLAVWTLERPERTAEAAEAGSIEARPV